MSYALYDFEESLKQTGRFGFGKDDVAEVLAAWGGSPEGGGSWTGGFLLSLKDGRFAYLTGWCDYTGWGCQDGINCEFFATKPDLATLSSRMTEDKTYGWDEEAEGWDEQPTDLNNFLMRPSDDDTV